MVTFEVTLVSNPEKHTLTGFAADNDAEVKNNECQCQEQLNDAISCSICVIKLYILTLTTEEVGRADTRNCPY